MGRNPKVGVDNFSHDVLACLKQPLLAIQEQFGNDGYAFWYKLWEFIGTKQNLYADFSDRKEWQYFISIADVSESDGEEILSLFAQLDAIDKNLWIGRRIVWSDSFRGRVAYIFTKRGLPIPPKPVFEGVKASENKPPTISKNTNKKQYAEYVAMTESEYSALISKYGESVTAKSIEVLDNYKGSSGKTYKSDYRAILSWVIDKLREERKELFTGKAESATDSNPFDEYGD